jgi:hypothetical protein
MSDTLFSVIARSARKLGLPDLRTIDADLG